MLRPAGARNPRVAKEDLPLPAAMRLLAPSQFRPLLVNRVTSHCAAAGALLELRGGGVDSRAVATALGWTISATALTLYTPIISSLLRSRSVPESMSSTTWALQVMGFGIFVVYHVRKGFPLSTYFDFVGLALQSLAVLVLIVSYRRSFDPAVVLPVAAVLAAMVAPPAALDGLQLAATATSTWALLPQIVRNMRARSRGGWSPFSGTIATVNNAIRVFTTLTLADANPLLLVQFVTRCLLNGVLLVQSLVWR